MDKETKALNFEIKAVNEDGTFTGVASAYGEPPDAYGDVIEPGAFTKTIADHAGEVVVLWQHDQTEPVGWGMLEDGEGGLTISGRLELELDTAKKAYIALSKKLVRGLSIGFKTIRKKTVEGVRRLQEIKLYEVSLVTFPANERALITGVKSAFSEEMDRRKLSNGVWGAYIALENVIYAIVFDREMKSDDKIDILADAIDEFKAAFLTALPAYLSMNRLSSDPDKSLTAESRAAIEGEIKSLQAILQASSTDKAAAPEQVAGSAPEARLDAFHPDLSMFRDSLVNALRN